MGEYGSLGEAWLAVGLAAYDGECEPELPWRGIAADF